MDPAICPHMAALPALIRIGGFDFKIEKWNAPQAASNQRHGECSLVEQTLRFETFCSSRFRAADLVLHEIGHAIWWAMGVEDGDKQERMIATLASGWMQVYRDNPWLLKWLQKALK